MPQGKGTYGSQVGRPSKQEDEGNETILTGSNRTSFVNDNKWWGKLATGLKGVGSNDPKLMLRSTKNNASGY